MNEASAGDEGGKGDESGATRILSPAAQRALAEAEQRRKAREAQQAIERPPEKEVDGRGGLDPTRYGDWEIKGLTSDF